MDKVGKIMSKKENLKALTLGAIGVVYGDIGTSPLYTMKEVFDGVHKMPLVPENVLAILSLIFWSLIFVVSIKYVAVIMRADNNGEGGIVALMELGLRTTETMKGENKSLNTKWMIALGIFGAALFFGDGVITPAISVLSAVEGIQILEPSSKEHVIPITLCVLFGLFWAQKKGTGKIGALFGPVMCFWFLAIATFGAVNIFKEPTVLTALNPMHAIDLIVNHKSAAFFSLGGVVLALTGAEALYADMGHFGRKPIQIAWFWLVLPALTLNYFGQGALLIRHADAIENPFYLLVPSWALFPMIILATAATIIASQAVISGTFSVAKQAMQLGYSPRLNMIYTSEKEMGQVYLPFVNWALLFMIGVLVVSFKSSTNLGAAYGIAVTGTMVITTILAFVVVKDLWKWHWLAGTAVISLFMMVDLAYFAANAVKIGDGGWIPLLMGLFAYTLMMTWKKERTRHLKKSGEDDMDLEQFIKSMQRSSPFRPDGTAVYLTGNAFKVPHALLHNLYHNKVLHNNILLTSVKTLNVPHVDEKNQIQVQHLGYGFHRILVSYGFKDDPNIPKALDLSKNKNIDYEPMRTSYFLGRDSIVPRAKSGLRHWREVLYIWMFKNAGSASEYFRIPPNRVIELGTQREL